METVSVFNLVGFIASLASLILAVVAIWITFYNKGESDKVNQKSMEILTEIKSDSKTISQIAMPELKAYGDSVRKFIFHSKKTEASEEDNLKFNLSEKLSNIEKSLTQLTKETDNSSIKRKLETVTEQVEESKNISNERNSFRGVILNLNDNFKIETSSEKENMEDLLEFLFAVNSQFKLSPDNYNSKWYILNKRTNKKLDADLIKNKAVSFKDFEIEKGDELVLVVTES